MDLLRFFARGCCRVRKANESMATKLSLWGLLPSQVPINVAGDAVDVNVSLLESSPGGATAPQSELLLYLTTLKATGGPYDTLTLHLFNTSLNPTQQSTLSDFTGAEAAFTGYTASALTWLAPSNSGTNGGLLVSQIVQFLASGTPTPEIIKGWFLTHA